MQMQPVFVGAILSVAFAGAAAANPRIDITDKGFAYGGKSIDLPARPEALIAALGAPSRSTDPAEQRLANHIHTWDKLGVYAYVDKHSGRVVSFAISFDATETLAFAPKQAFAGEVRTPWGTFNATTSFTDAKQQGFKSEPSLRDLVRRNRGPLALLAAFKSDLSSITGFHIGVESDLGVTELGVQLRGTEIQLPATRADLENVLGPADRTEAGSLIWDSFGLVALLNRDRSLVKGIRVALAPGVGKSAPKAVFGQDIETPWGRVDDETHPEGVLVRGFSRDPQSPTERYSRKAGSMLIQLTVGPGAGAMRRFGECEILFEPE